VEGSIKIKQINESQLLKSAKSNLIKL
jgi:hypothetical protein